LFFYFYFTKSPKNQNQGRNQPFSPFTETRKNDNFTPTASNMIAAIETRDIYRASYLVICGGEIIDTLNQDRRTTFFIEGENVTEDDRNFRSGQALVNPVRLRETLNLLRDLYLPKPANRKIPHVRAHQVT